MFALLLPGRPIRSLMLALLGTLAAAISGCGPTEEQRLASIYATSTTSPAAARAELVKQWTAGTIKLDSALHLAHAQVEKGDPASPSFAFALIGAITDLQAAIAKKEINEFFWFRVGTVAGGAAAVAYKAGDLPGARSLVLAGPNRWQNEAYWRLHPDHDALASWIMHKSGESGPALARLRERAEPDEQVTSTIQRIQAEQQAIEAAKTKAAKAAKGK